MGKEGDILHYQSPDNLPLIITKQYIEVQSPMRGNIFGNFTVEQIKELGINISSGNLQAIESFYSEHYKLPSGASKYFNFALHEGKLWIDHVDEDQKTVHETIEVQQDKAILRMMPE